MLDGAASFEGQYYVWDVDQSGVIRSGSGWKTTQQAVETGWEKVFSLDMNLDNVVS